MEFSFLTNRLWWDSKPDFIVVMRTFESLGQVPIYKYLPSYMAEHASQYPCRRRCGATFKKIYRRMVRIPWSGHVSNKKILRKWKHMMLIIRIKNVQINLLLWISSSLLLYSDWLISRYWFLCPSLILESPSRYLHDGLFLFLTPMHSDFFCVWELF